MPFFERLGAHLSLRMIENPRPDLLVRASFITGTSARGLPAVQLSLVFQSRGRAAYQGLSSKASPMIPTPQPRAGVTNPEMSLVLLLDRSYSMAESFAESTSDRVYEKPVVPKHPLDYTQPLFGNYTVRRSYATGHVYQVATAILDYIGVNYDLVLYDEAPLFVGPIRHRTGGQGADLLSIIAANDPFRRNPGRSPTPPVGYVTAASLQNDTLPGFNLSLLRTNLTAALQGAVEKYRTQRGLYVIVITKGEITDKREAQSYILNTLLPQLTADNPNAYRIHFVVAGEGEPSEFLQQLETEAAERNVVLVKHEHHAYFGQSHFTIFDELDRSFVGIAPHVVVGEPNTVAERALLLRVGNQTSGRWYDGPLCDIGFLPYRAEISLEVRRPHPPGVNIVIRYSDLHGTNQEIPLYVPLL
jgi:hypothetical protein